MYKTEILSKLDIPSFYQSFIPSLKVNGKAEALCLCCFYNDTNPRLGINNETGLYRCFACGAKGDAISFYQKYKDVDFKSDNNKERLIELVKNTPAWTPKNEESQKGSFTLTKLGDLFQEPEEQTKWLTDRLLPTGGFSIIAAKPKVGKSTIARELALNVAKGESFLDRDVSTRIPASRTRKKRY